MTDLKKKTKKISLDDYSSFVIPSLFLSDLWFNFSHTFWEELFELGRLLKILHSDERIREAVGKDADQFIRCLGQNWTDDARAEFREALINDFLRRV